MTRLFTDRSRIETRERCARRRFHEYHDGPAARGVVLIRMPLPLAVGISVHCGQESMLRACLDTATAEAVREGDVLTLRRLEETAVTAALEDFAQYVHAGLSLDGSEAGDLTAGLSGTPANSYDAQLLQQAAALGMRTEGLGMAPEERLGRFEERLGREQSALVEGMVRAYARRRLRPLLEEFEVLEVEREGEWKLAEWGATVDYDAMGRTENPHTHELWFMSRPDALLRHRATNELYLLSYKTASGWDVRKAKAAEHDMQGLSEGIEVELRLREWWIAIHAKHLDFASGTSNNTPELKDLAQAVYDKSGGMYDFLVSCSAPPRIHAIRYEYLQKGERWKDKDLSASLGIPNLRTQRSPLIRQYVAVSTPMKGTSAYATGDVCWSWDYLRAEDQKESSLAWQNWKGRSVWEAGPGAMREWIDRLDRSEEVWSGEEATIGMEPRRLGWRSDAQAVGVTTEHPLDSVFTQPVTVYRNDDEVRDLVEQMEAAERRTAEGAMVVAAAKDAGERRSLLNVHFPQTRAACHYPVDCAFLGVCYAGTEEGRRDAMTTGLYRIRVPNHPQEQGDAS